MGGLGPGIGGFEILVIGLVALLVVGPRDLPVLMRRLGKVMAKARGMANEFRASFDEMARQSELDDLRKEVEALRAGQGMHPLGPDAEAAFREIRADLDKPVSEAAPPIVEEWAEAPGTPEPVPPVTPPKKARAKASPSVAPKPAAKAASKPRSTKKAAKPAAAPAAAARPRKARP